MKTIEQQLSDCIDRQEHYELITSNGIIISALDDDLLQAAFTLNEMDDAELKVCFCCEKKGFVNTLGFKNVHDINALSPFKLIALYIEGLAKMVCFVTLKFTYCMSFQKLRYIIVAENYWGVKHNVPVVEKLEMPGQFIFYTKQNYKLMKGHEN